MRRFLFAALLVFTAFLRSGTAAEPDPKKFENCRLIIDAATGKVIVREGPCDIGQSPCSTFKIPLALMGFDAGILKNEHDPVWDYRPEYESNRPEEQKKIDPTSWELLSVVWYSQKLTRELGPARFKHYVDQFSYGNRNVAGNPGKNDGLTQSWLLSSLLISPEEQTLFLQKLLQKKLDVSDRATEMTVAILPKFPAADGWTVTGKTGSGFQRKADGSLNRKMHLGWFVGWADQGTKRVIFAEFLADQTPNDNYAGPRARERFIKALPVLMRDKGSAE